MNINDYQIEMNFQRDMANILRLKIDHPTANVAPQAANETDRQFYERVSIQFYNYLHRLVTVKPRTVHRSNVFTCPPEVEAGLETIERKIANGETLIPHLSTRLSDLDYQDDMLSDWGIYHLHLGTTIQPNGFVNRTGPLLYAKFDEDNAYLINIYPHQNWTDQDMVRVLHNNWPESIAPYRLQDVIGLEHVPTNNDVRIGRRAHVNLGIEIEHGVVYMPIGGGMATDGTPIAVTMNMIQQTRWIRNQEAFVRQNIVRIAEACAADGYNGPIYRFTLQQDAHGDYEALETNTNITLGL